MFIFTGMDNSGKTTLVGEMSKVTGTPVIKSPGPNLTPDEKKVWLLDQMAREKAFAYSVIFDRFLPLEEMVYGKVLRGDPMFTLDDPFMESLKELNPIIIYTRPPRECIFNFGDREQMPGVVEEKEKLLAAWDDLMWILMTRGWKVYPYDYTTGQGIEDLMTSIADQIMKEIRDSLKRMKNHQEESFVPNPCPCGCDKEEE